MITQNIKCFRPNKNIRKAFSLVELVVVILILGVIAAIAAPRMFDTADQARVSSTRQSLSVIRNAIEIFRAQTGNYPAGATFAADIRPYLNSPIPVPAAETRSGVTSDVLVDATAAPTGPGSLDATVDVTGNEGWVYRPATGAIRVNSADATIASW